MTIRKLTILCFMLFSLSIVAQKEGENKSFKTVIKVDGKCKMCKTRIEKACLKTKGVKFALWSIEEKTLHLIYNQQKTSIKTIQENIAAVGHDTELIQATDQSYDAIHPCCKYRDL